MGCCVSTNLSGADDTVSSFELQPAITPSSGRTLADAHKEEPVTTIRHNTAASTAQRRHSGGGKATTAAVGGGVGATSLSEDATTTINTMLLPALSEVQSSTLLPKSSASSRMLDEEPLEQQQLRGRVDNPLRVRRLSRDDDAAATTHTTAMHFTHQIAALSAVAAIATKNFDSAELAEEIVVDQPPPTAATTVSPTTSAPNSPLLAVVAVASSSSPFSPPARASAEGSPAAATGDDTAAAAAAKSASALVAGTNVLMLSRIGDGSFVTVVVNTDDEDEVEDLQHNGHRFGFAFDTTQAYSDMLVTATIGDDGGDDDYEQPLLHGEDDSQGLFTAGAATNNKNNNRRRSESSGTRNSSNHPQSSTSTGGGGGGRRRRSTTKKLPTSKHQQPLQGSAFTSIKGIHAGPSSSQTMDDHDTAPGGQSQQEHERERVVVPTGVELEAASSWHGESPTRPWVMEAIDLSTVASAQRVALQVASLSSRNGLLNVALNASSTTPASRTQSTCTLYVPSPLVPDVHPQLDGALAGGGGSAYLTVADDPFRLNTRTQSDDRSRVSSERTVGGFGPTREPSATVPPLDLLHDVMTTALPPRETPL